MKNVVITEKKRFSESLGIAAVSLIPCSEKTAEEQK